MTRNHLTFVRSYRKNDSIAAARVIFAAAGKAYAYFNWNYSLAEIVDWIAEDSEGWTNLWVAESNGVLVGFMALKDSFIDQLFVSPEWQGYGIGGDLMRTAKHLFPAGLSLKCAQQNWPAVAFYERQGFIPISHHLHQPEGIGAIFFRWHGH